MSYSSPPVHGTEFQSFQRRIKKRTLGVFLKRRQTNYDFGEPKLGGLHLNLKFILTFEMTSEVWEGNEHCTVNSGVAKTDVQYLFF